MRHDATQPTQRSALSVVPHHRAILLLAACLGFMTLATGSLAGAAAPLDLWTPDVLERIRDRSTLNLQIIPKGGYFEVFYDSEAGEAKWADSEPPYEVHTGDTIRIHGYLALPTGGGPYPAVLIGHGRGGSASLTLAQAFALLGYGAFAIDGPDTGLSTGGPRNTEQAWISVEEHPNEPAPEVGFLYHWAYAGMRALTVLEDLADQPSNPFRIDSSRLGVVGASMGGQLTYYINGVDDRVKAAVAIAVAGDLQNIMLYPGSWLYHGLYYYTRDGLMSGVDGLNTVSSCDDPTLRTFLDYYDPIKYAPTQQAPLLTIIGSHDQYFTVPAINTTFDRVRSAGTTERFRKRITVIPNGEHEVVDSDDDLTTLLSLLGTINGWLRYGFGNGPNPPSTPSVRITRLGDWMIFKVKAEPGATRIIRAQLNIASQIDTTPESPCDFESVPLYRSGGNFYGTVRVGQVVRCGPPLSPENILYFASITDRAGYTFSSMIYRGTAPMKFSSGCAPTLEHWRGDDFPVPLPPICSAAAP